MNIEGILLDICNRGFQWSLDTVERFSGNTFFLLVLTRENLRLRTGVELTLIATCRLLCNRDVEVCPVSV